MEEATGHGVDDMVGRAGFGILRPRDADGGDVILEQWATTDDALPPDLQILTKSGERSAAIGLLRQAIVLDPRDLSTHRRLAAALALAGDTDASVQEYARFIRDLRDSGESERAKKEVAYAKGQLRDVSGVSTLDAIADGQPSVATPAETEEPATRFSEREAGSALRPPAFDQWTAPRSEPAPRFVPPAEPRMATPADDPWAAPPPTTYPRSTPSDQEQGRVFQDLSQKLYAVVSQYATQNGYAVVLDVSNNQQSPILWAAASTDITNDIVKLYDQAHPAAAAAAPAPAAARPAPAAVPPARKKQ